MCQALWYAGVGVLRSRGNQAWVKVRAPPCEWETAASCENWSTGWENICYLLSGPRATVRGNELVQSVCGYFIQLKHKVEIQL